VVVAAPPGIQDVYAQAHIMTDRDGTESGQRAKQFKGWIWSRGLEIHSVPIP
jgi:hypothetical protein